MRSKAVLTLMEQTVMLLVFALAAALCLQIFAHAQEISVETARWDEAVVMAQNAAELLKAGEAPEDIENKLKSDTHAVQIRRLPEEIPGLMQAEILTFCDESELFSLVVGYPEVD